MPLPLVLVRLVPKLMHNYLGLMHMFCMVVLLKMWQIGTLAGLVGYCKELLRLTQTLALSTAFHPLAGG